MQYILDQSEMDEIRDNQKRLLQLGGLENHMIALTNVCRYVVTQMAEVGGNLANGRKPSDRPHGCIHDSLNRARYCDRCPVAGICPQSKEWSK